MSRRVSRSVAYALAFAAVLAVAAATSSAAPSAVTIRSVISGQVLPLQLATVGQAVKLGDPLVFVRTTTGAAQVAAGATVNGRVSQVLVRTGDFVNIGDAVVVVEPQ